MTGVRSCSVAMACAFLLAGCVSSGTSALSWYPTQNARAPQGLTLGICHAFGCQRQTDVRLADSDVQELASIMRGSDGSPASERDAVKRAVMWMEARVGPVVGSDHDIGGLDLQNAGVPGQMDCLDETTNTTTTLLLLQESGLLVHHRVAYPVARGFFLDGRYPHATAVLEETETAERWAIDPWPYANAEDVDVMPLNEWYATWPSIG
ncbi:MAG: hypothetical protein AAF590_10175 [Pseudomonadota bacterium]